jgi:hypothetical protein
VPKLHWFPLAFLLLSCGGAGSSPAAAPANTATAAVQSFMKAVADSNLTAMANLWGTASGPASETKQPPDWQKRIAVMQAYLKSDSYRLTGDGPGTDSNHRDVQVEIKRQVCTWSVPFVAVKSGQRWLVTQVDISAAGNPARPCEEGTTVDSAHHS